MTLDAIWVATERKALPEAHDNIKEALIARGATMFMDSEEGREARVAAFKRVLRAAMTVAMDLAAVRRLSRSVLETRVNDALE